MSKDLNMVQLIGRLGGEVEIRYTTSGVAVASFSIATGEEWKNEAGEKQSKTTWHNICAWRRLAEVCGEFLHKGSKVYVSGKLDVQMREKDGQKHYKTQVVVDNLIMLDGARQGQAAPASPEESAAPAGADSDLPF